MVRMPLWTSRVVGGVNLIYTVCVCVFVSSRCARLEKQIRRQTIGSASNPAPARQKICTNPQSLSTTQKIYYQNKRRKKKRKEIFTIHLAILDSFPVILSTTQSGRLLDFRVGAGGWGGGYVRDGGGFPVLDSTLKTAQDGGARTLGGLGWSG